MRAHLLLLMLGVGLLGSCGRSEPDDLVVLRDGTTKSGALSACTADGCTLSGETIARAAILLIGLHGNLKPPPIRDPLHDELHFTDDAIVAATMTGVDASTVATDQESYPRERVAWIYLAPRLAASGTGGGGSPADAGVTYEWSGTIAVHNQYDGSEGHHLWQVVYTVKLLEIETTSSVPGQGGRSFRVNDFVPVAFAYDMKADQTWDKGSYALQTNAAGKIIYGSVTMRGHASGQLPADVLKLKGALRGELVRLDEPTPASAPPATSFESESEYFRTLDNVGNPSEPGWFDFFITFRGFSDNGLERDVRALYRGIDRGGQNPPFFADPDADFIHWVPPWMPEGTNVIGRLDSPDQSEVHGSAAFPRQGPGPPQDREQITLDWSFTRARK